MKYLNMLLVLFLLGACGDLAKPKDCEIKEVKYYVFNAFNQWVGPSYQLLCIVKEEKIQ